jgi:hypothetical protein
VPGRSPRSAASARRDGKRARRKTTTTATCRTRAPTAATRTPSVAVARRSSACPPPSSSTSRNSHLPRCRLCLTTWSKRLVGPCRPSSIWCDLPRRISCCVAAVTSGWAAGCSAPFPQSRARCWSSTWRTPA